MWYSADGFYEPFAIGYASSEDGINWTKNPHNPIFQGKRTNYWECERNTAAQVLIQTVISYLFCVGFQNITSASIGLARSRDCLKWERYPSNPILQPTVGGWDKDSTYKPFVIFNRKKWMLSYNGRSGALERIGLAIHKGQLEW